MIKIKKVDDKALMITIHIGNGETPDGTKFEMLTTTSGAMMVDFENGKRGDRFFIGWENFIKECDKIRLKGSKKK